MQVVPAEYGAQLPLLFPCYRAYWREGDTRQVPTLREALAAAWTRAVAATWGRSAAHEGLDRAAPVHGQGRRHGAKSRPLVEQQQQQPWIAEDGARGKLQPSTGPVLAEMRGLRKVGPCAAGVAAVECLLLAGHAQGSRLAVPRRCTGPR